MQPNVSTPPCTRPYLHPRLQVKVGGRRFYDKRATTVEDMVSDSEEMLPGERACLLVAQVSKKVSVRPGQRPGARVRGWCTQIWGASHLAAAQVT